MRTSASDPGSVVVPLLDPEPQRDAQPSPSNARQDLQGLRQSHNKLKNRTMASFRANSLCLAAHGRQSSGQHVHRRFKNTMRALQLDHSQTCTSFLSWITGLLLLVIVPVLRVCFVKVESSDTSHQLVFQPLVVVVGIALSLVSFLFLSQAIRRHGLRGVLFLDAAEEDIMEVQNEYEAIIEKGRSLLAKLFIPSFLIYIVFRVWFFSEITLCPLSFTESMDAISLVVIIVLLATSWIFQTTTYLYTCILFATVCGFQELKMIKFKQLLEKGLDPEFYFYKYVKIMKGLRATSRRFRFFLALILAVTVVGFLASMYQLVEAERSGINMLMSVEIVVLNLVSLSGTGLCLWSSSKVSHLHRRIVKAAAMMHATGTFEAVDASFLCPDGHTKSMECLHKLYQMQDGWTRRAAFVNFLSTSSVGISVYGFILDRFFIHASVGALLTTTWFILGRSLS